jgi:DNA ligase-associated metallophosphoesterase
MAEAAQHLSGTGPATLIGVQGTVLEALPEGALWWEGERLLAVADLHLEKGSSFARRGQMLPPYDTVETLSRLAVLVRRLNPATVVALGDSFHDDGGAGRMTPRDRAALVDLQRGRNWIWIAGNHDPKAPAGLDGDCLDMLTLGSIRFRHEPSATPTDGEIAGHLHPAARVAGRGKSVRRPCFVGDGTRLVLPAFGAYAGGLNVLDRAFAGLFARPFRAFVLGKDRVYAVARTVLRHG